MITDQELNDAQATDNIPGVDAFEIDTAKFGSVSQLVKAYFPDATDEQIRDFVLADWHEGKEHQEWLDDSSPQQIANWVIGSNPEFI